MKRRTKRSFRPVTEHDRSPLLEIANVLVRLNHIASVIGKLDDSVMGRAETGGPERVRLNWARKRLGAEFSTHHTPRMTLPLLTFDVVVLAAQICDSGFG